MLKERYTIVMHSFVDLITNSSTEIYIEATNKTIESLKGLITNLLKLGGSKLTCDDLFTIEIDKERFNKEYEGYGEDTTVAYDEWSKEEYHEEYRSVYLMVKCRDENNPLGKATAAVLADLTGLFDMDARYDG